jgi:hypothetical protein
MTSALSDLLRKFSKFDPTKILVLSGTVDSLRKFSKFGLLSTECAVSFRSLIPSERELRYLSTELRCDWLISDTDDEL